MKNFRLSVRPVNRTLLEWNEISGRQFIERVFGDVTPEPINMTIRARTKEGKWVHISIPYEGENGEPSAWISEDETLMTD